MPDDELAQLVRRAAGGSEEAAQQLLDVYGHHLRRVVRRRLERGQQSAFDSRDFVRDVLPSIFNPAQGEPRAPDRPETLVDVLADTICKQIVHAFRERAENSPGQGALDDVDRRGGEPEILVVDDEEAILKMLDLALQGHGFRVRQAANGREAIDVYQAHHRTVDLVFMDVQMEGLDGPQALAALRQINPQVRCCLMTGHAGSYGHDELMKLGVDRVLQKPFSSLAELAQILRQAISA